MKLFGRPYAANISFIFNSLKNQVQLSTERGERIKRKKNSLFWLTKTRVLIISRVDVSANAVNDLFVIKMIDRNRCQGHRIWNCTLSIITWLFRFAGADITYIIILQFSSFRHQECAKRHIMRANKKVSGALDSKAPLTTSWTQKKRRRIVNCKLYNQISQEIIKSPWKYGINQTEVLINSSIIRFEFCDNTQEKKKKLSSFGSINFLNRHYLIFTCIFT